VRGELPVCVVLASGRDHGADQRGQLQERTRGISAKRRIIAMGQLFALLIGFADQQQRLQCDWNRGLLRHSASFCERVAGFLNGLLGVLQMRRRRVVPCFLSRLDPG
jgi:hypothetical protein